MRALFRATLDCFVRNEPGFAATTFVTAARMGPTRDIAFVLIRDAESEPVDVDLATDREMKNVFVAIVEKSFGTDRFEMAERATIDRDGLDPVNRILENEEIANTKNYFVRQHRI